MRMSSFGVKLAGTYVWWQAMINRRRLLHYSAAAPLAGAAAFAFSTPTPAWQAGPALPIRAQELYPTVHNGELIVAGGIAARMGVPYFTAKCFALNPQTQQWREEDRRTRLQEMQERRYNTQQDRFLRESAKVINDRVNQGMEELKANLAKYSVGF